MKSELYTFEKDGVKLPFTFEIGPKNVEQKLIFITLMKEAIAALEKEINITPKP